MIFVRRWRDTAVLILIVMRIRSTDYLLENMAVYLYLSRGGTERFELVAGCRLHVAAKLLRPEL